MDPNFNLIKGPTELEKYWGEYFQPTVSEWAKWSQNVLSELPQKVADFSSQYFRTVSPMEKLTSALDINLQAVNTQLFAATQEAYLAQEAYAKAQRNTQSAFEKALTQNQEAWEQLRFLVKKLQEFQQKIAQTPLVKSLANDGDCSSEKEEELTARAAQELITTNIEDTSTFELPNGFQEQARSQQIAITEQAHEQASLLATQCLSLKFSIFTTELSESPLFDSSQDALNSQVLEQAVVNRQNTAKQVLEGMQEIERHLHMFYSLSGSEFQDCRISFAVSSHTKGGTENHSHCPTFQYAQSNAAADEALENLRKKGEEEQTAKQKLEQANRKCQNLQATHNSLTAFQANLQNPYTVLSPGDPLAQKTFNVATSFPSTVPLEPPPDYDYYDPKQDFVVVGSDPLTSEEDK